MPIDELKAALHVKFPDVRAECEADARGILTLRGECSDWEQWVAIGHWAAKQPGVKNVVSRMTVAGMEIPKKDYEPFKRRGLEIGPVDEADVLIIGAGISGCGIARELSKYKLNILVAEKSEDVATGATKANNGNIHPGHAVKPGTLKAKLNVKGNRMYTRWAEELGFELQRCGSMGAITHSAIMPGLEQALAVARANGVDGAEIVDGKKAYELEPGLKRRGVENVVAALWLPSMGLVESYKVAVALAENAAQNGARFLFNCTVADILREGGKVTGAVTNRGIIKAKYIINCAGVYADDISEMAGDACFTIHPRKGVIAILDKSKTPIFNGITEVYGIEAVTASQKKNENSKGGGMCHTPEGNILMGPSATEIPDKDDLSTTPEDLAYAMGRGNGVGYGDVIRFFAGNRPADFTEDFVIGMSDITDGFINVGAIQSPGLAAAPAIAEMAEQILADSAAKRGEPLQKNPSFNPIRKREAEFRLLDRAGQDALIKKNPAYGRIICRCESITEGEILDAIHSPVPPASIDAVKRRTRAGMGRCQGGFCQPRVLELLAREMGVEWVRVNLRGEGTNVLIEGNRPEADAQKVGGR
jgi:glycerol-3-phosphate dehydrogenase